MGFLSNLLGAVFSVASAVIGAVKIVASDIVDAVRGGTERLFEAKKIKDTSDDELKNINDELLYILNKYKNTGKISPTEKKKAEYLVERRKELQSAINGADEIIVENDISEAPEAFEQFVIDNDKAHILQGHVGVSVFGKKCHKCGRDMQIQWPNSVTTAKVTDFFWGCTGWYIKNLNGQPLCSVTLNFNDDDFNIFTRMDIPESQVSNSELTDLVLLPGPREIVTERMNDVISDQRSHHRGTDHYRCPTHGEEMLLRKKNQATSLLDQYFLGCPRWKPNNQGCGYIVKLKSVMQLSTLLKKETGSGLL